MNTENTHKEKAERKVVELATRELRQLKENMQALPDVHLNKLELEAGWDEIQASVGNVSSNKSPTWAWVSFAACAALLTVFAFKMSFSSLQDSTQNQLPLQAELISSPARSENSASALDIKTLKQFNRAVENRLQALPEQPRLVRANTMDTIARLEDQIALLDYRLELQEQQPLSAAEYRDLWQQRAKSINGLYQIKSAQVQRSRQASLYQQPPTFQRIAY